MGNKLKEDHCLAREPLHESVIHMFVSKIELRMCFIYKNFIDIALFWVHFIHFFWICNILDSRPAVM